MFEDEGVAILLAFDDAAAVLDGLLVDEGTPEEQACLEALRAEGLVHVWSPESDDDASAAVPGAADGPRERVEAAVLVAREGAAGGADLALLEAVPPSSLPSTSERLAYLRRCDRVVALAQALRAEAVVALAGEKPSDQYLTEVQTEKELAVAARCSHYAAGRSIETARALATTFPAFAEALATGEVSQGHCTVLVDRTRLVTDREALASIERLAVRRARRMAVGPFAREVSALVARFDPDAAERVRRARQQRRVSVRQMDDGLGHLGLVHDWTVVRAIYEQVSADARVLRGRRRAARAADRGREEALGIGALPSESEALASDDQWRARSADDALDLDDARLDPCRADALAARVLGVPVGDDGLTAADGPAPVEVSLVIDLETLRGEADHPCLLDGTPVPAELGRELAAQATAFRRLVTDPVDGHLLDYGRRTYLPGPLRSYVAARDGGCRAPGCGVRSAARLQLDHAVPFPEGPSSAANTGMLCTTCHQLKTAGGGRLHDGAADGSVTWVTAAGQHVRVPARPVLPGLDHDPPTREASPSRDGSGSDPPAADEP